MVVRHRCWIWRCMARRRRGPRWTSATARRTSASLRRSAARCSPSPWPSSSPRGRWCSISFRWPSRRAARSRRTSSPRPRRSFRRWVPAVVGVSTDDIDTLSKFSTAGLPEQVCGGLGSDRRRSITSYDAVMRAQPGLRQPHLVRHRPQWIGGLQLRQPEPRAPRRAHAARAARSGRRGQEGQVAARPGRGTARPRPLEVSPCC